MWRRKITEYEDIMSVPHSNNLQKDLQIEKLYCVLWVLKYDSIDCISCLVEILLQKILIEIYKSLKNVHSRLQNLS